MPQGKLLIGRATDCQLRLDSNLVSLHHCVLLLDEYALRIRDLGSKNGTIVNGSRIGTHESILQHDDTVSIDELTFEIDLGRSADVIIADTDGQPLVTRNALDETSIIEGDTGQSVAADVPRHVSPLVPSQVDSSSPEAAPVEHAGMHRQFAAPIGSERRSAAASLATASLASVASPRATLQKGQRTVDAGPAVALENRSEQSVAKPKTIVKAKQDATGTVARAAKKSSGSIVASKMAIAGLIALVGLVGGGTFLLRGPSQEAPYTVPQKYIVFNPKSYADILNCEVPEDWKQQISGGQNIGPIRARFTDGRLSIEICEKLWGSNIREAVVAVRQKADPARRGTSPTELIHEHQRHQSSENFKSYSEEPRSRGMRTKGFGEAQISDFTATEGILGTEVRGCRATVVSRAHQFTVTCKCPPSLFRDAKPVFEKVISTLDCGVVAPQ